MILAAAGSMRPAGIRLPGKGRPVSGSLTITPEPGFQYSTSSAVVLAALAQIGADCTKHQNDFELEHGEHAYGRQRQFGRWTERENNSASQPPLSRFAYTFYSRHCFISFAASG
ncbi:MAG TPA: hypothetical protein VG324_28870 [Blastocatellia bacterium]|nr:hypothetical protein [Blastocatellia bacterium]